MTIVKALLRGASVLAGLAGGSLAHAQSAPPATVDPGAIGRGLIDQRMDVPRPSREPQEVITGEGLEPGPGPGPEQPGIEAATFVLKGVSFDASSFLSAAELDAIVTPLIGRKVSLADLRTVAAQVNLLYASRGIATARAYVPPQRIVDGAVRIALLEGRLGEMRVADGRYTGADFIRSRLSVEPGTVLDLDRLRRDLALFNRYNDVRVQAQLQPGSEVGLTDVLVSLSEPPQNALQIYADTYGYSSTGRYQGGVVARSNSLLIDGDRANIFLSASDGGLTGSASYNIPVGLSRIGVTYARSQIRVTQGPSASLDIEGFSDTASINFARPVAERDRWYASMVANISYSASENRLSDSKVGESEVYKGTAGLSFGADPAPGTSLGLNLTTSVARADDSLASGSQTFAMFNGDFSAAQAMTDRLSLRFVAAGQYVGTDFIPSNQLFQIGGISTVRGFQPGTASGRSGFYTQTELHYLAPVGSRGADLFAFFDNGKAYSPDFGNRGLASVGVGLRMPIWRFSLDATYGIGISPLRAGESRSRADARLVLSF